MESLKKVLTETWVRILPKQFRSKINDEAGKMRAVIERKRAHLSNLKHQFLKADKTRENPGFQNKKPGIP